MPKQLKVDMCVDLAEALKAEVDRKAVGTRADLGPGIELAEKRGLQKGNNAG